MASILPDYEYDIFISYRQKDNKGDRWVSEFVESLKTELESTFKEEVSVYFDINPHDGLLETHEVDASLKEKLKCLIFIPIISQTYCDPKSYAWQFEFCAFNKLAKEDQFGRDIRLAFGNVASRILPVKIHDLEPEDRILLENELGGPLRGIEFIYKSAGVNRPLRANEDHPQESLNKNYYRDQINKTANAVKEIINALKNPQKHYSETPGENIKPKVKSSINRKTIIITGSVLALALMIVGYFFFPKLIESGNQVEKSIAVLPFVNDSQDQENAYFINGIMDEILNNLQKIKDFRVLSRTSTEQFKGANKPTIPEIAKKLNVNYVVEGSGQKYGNSIRLSVQLIAANNEKHLYGESFEKEISATKDIFNIQSQIAQTIASRLLATITPEEKQLIEKIPTINLTAYDFYQRGQEEIDKHRGPECDPVSLKRAEVFFRNALEYDSTYAQAYFGLAEIAWKKIDKYTLNSQSGIRQQYFDTMLVLANKALSYNEHLDRPYVIRSSYYAAKGDLKKTIEELDKAIRYNPNDSWAYQSKGQLYEEMDMVKALENFQKAASLNHDSNLNYLLTKIGVDYYETGFPEKGKYFFQEVLKLDGDSVGYSARIINNTAALQGDYKTCIEYFEKRYLKDSTDVEVHEALGIIYSIIGQYKESLEHFKKYIKASNQTNPAMSEIIGYAFLQNGYRKEADYYFDKKIESVDTGAPPNPNDIYWAFPLAGIYACRGDKVRAYEYLKRFNLNQYFTLDWVTNLKHYPLFNSIRKEPEFQKILMDVEAKYQAQHERVGKWLKEQG